MVDHVEETCFDFSLIVIPTIVDGNLLAIKDNVILYLSSTQVDVTSTLVQESLEQLYNRANDYYSQMNSDGSWSDLDYYAEPQSAFDSGAHFQRLAVLARTYVTPNQSFYRDNELLQYIELGLTYIHQYIFKGCNTPGNYWWWKVSIPQELGTILLLLEGEIHSDIYINSLETMIYMMNLNEYIFKYCNHKIGATKLEICLNVLNYALIVGNTSLIQEIRAIMSENCRITGPDQIGIKDDYSYHYHYSQLYFGDYGTYHGEAITRYMLYTRGTAMQLSDQDKAVIVNYLAKGLSYSITDYYFDPSVLGRGYPRSPGSNIQLAVNAFTLMTEIDNDRQDYFISVVKKIISESVNLPDHPQIASYMAGIQNSPLAAAYPSGHKHYNRSDFTIHRTQDYYMSVKMLSERMIAYEYMNGDGKQSWHLSDGVTFVYFNGDEYYKNNLQPTLDWTRLPGTTVEQKEYDINFTAWYENYGTAKFVGGCHHSSYGVSAMAHEALQSDLVARKSWFFFDNEMVCLGSGITCDTANTTETIINQWPLSKEDETLYVDGQEKPAALNYSEALNNIIWAHCDNIGYYFPQPQSVNVKREMQIGKWSEITDAVGWDDTVHSNPFLTLWFDHGTAVRNGSYSYAVVPDITHTDMAAYADSNPFTILAHNNDIHGVRDKSTKSTGIVFWKAGSLGMVKVSKPCLVFYQMSKAGSRDILNISVCDPTQELDKLYVYLPFNTNTINIAPGVTVKPIIEIVNINPFQFEIKITTRLEIKPEGGKNYKCSFEVLE
jgi:chondroitin AC lyase